MNPILPENDDIFPTNVLAAAHWYCRRGFLVLPIAHREKACQLKDWPSLRLGEADLERYFSVDRPMNIGLVLGPRNLGDVDLDSPEAILAWQVLGLDTNFLFGRDSKPASHAFFWTKEELLSMQLIDPLPGRGFKACLLELRARKSNGELGMQTMVPPSTHPIGETVRFVRCGNPATVANADLIRAAKLTAAAAMLGRHVPEEGGGRHQYFLAIAGVLARAEWSLAEATRFVGAVYTVIWKNHAILNAAAKEVDTTFQRHDDGAETTGARTLVNWLDKKHVQKMRDWLDIPDSIEREAPPPVVGDGPPPNGAPPPPPVEEEDDSTPIVSYLSEGLRHADIKVPEILIPGILIHEAVTLIVGAPKVGKSVLAFELLFSVSSGQPLFGEARFPVETSLPALIIEQDDTAGKAALKKVILNARRYDPRCQFHWIAGPDEKYDLERNPLIIGSARFMRTIKYHCEEKGVRLIILDAYTSMRTARPQGIDIVKVEEKDMIILNEIAQKYGCAIVLIHHESKTATSQEDWALRGSGSYALPAKSVTQISISRVPKMGEKANERLVRIRSRYLPGREFILNYHPEHADFDFVMEGSSSSKYFTIVQLQEAFPDRAFTVKQCMEQLGWSRSLAYENLGALVRDGVLNKIDTDYFWRDTS
jgi:hypothetical protein